MNSLWIIIGIHAALLGFAFLFGDFMVVTAPSKEETAALRAQYEAARARSWWHGLLVSLDQTRSARRRGFAMTASHWPARPRGADLFTRVYFASRSLLLSVITFIYSTHNPRKT